MKFAYKNKKSTLYTTNIDRNDNLVTPDLDIVSRQNSGYKFSSAAKPLIYNNNKLYPYNYKGGRLISNIIFFISDKNGGPVYILVLKQLPDDGNGDEEIEMTKLRKSMKDILCQTSIINNTLLGDSIIMPYFDGDVLDLVIYNEDRFDDGLKFYIMQILTDALLCFLDKGYYYTDIKLEQLLYAKDSEGTITVRLGDLQLHHADITDGTVTSYPSPTYNCRSRPREYDMVWAVGVLILGFYVDTDKLFWKKKNNRIDAAKSLLKKARKVARSTPYLDIAEIILLGSDENYYPSIKDISNSLK